MDSKRAGSSAKALSFQAKPRINSTCNSKVNPLLSAKVIRNQNSPALTNKNSNPTPLSSAKSSASKDLKLRPLGSRPELCAEPHIEEAKADSSDIQMNTLMILAAKKKLLENSNLRIRGDIDKQIAALQKAVNDNLNTLEETRLRLDGALVLQEQSKFLIHHSEAFTALSNELAFMESKSLSELLSEIDRIKNRLPCTKFSVPDTDSKFADFHQATSQLLNVLEEISNTYGCNQKPIIDTCTELNQIKSSQQAVETTARSTDAISHYAVSVILDDAVKKLPNLKLNDLLE